MSDRLANMLDEMGGVGEPWGLFEPYLWKDKLGDSKWHCEVQSNCASFWHGCGNTVEEAVRNCYRLATDTPKKDNT